MSSKKIVGIIPARYSSSRLPGKPLADICGKPMIWWVYNQVKKVDELAEVYVATDDNRIKDACEEFGMKVIMTSDSHPTHIHRIHEVSEKIDSDLYLCICGDEPLIQPDVIRQAIPQTIEPMTISVLMREFTEPTEVIDPGNIKITTNNDGYCVSLSRSPIPFPYKTIRYKYKKIVGVECYNKQALDFFVSKDAGCIEKIEDVTLLRFLENRIPMKFHLVSTNALSVDTEKDLEKVRNLIAERVSK
ncbi:MAG: 3-deoxy-manno-octulosonate cytidylyltransferase [Muribaculaceae bacterium]|nr:3-deoxy-manno-octulosonate cytidylyltransferase [Muribaculaceae bacterium]